MHAKGGIASMPQQRIEQRASRVTRFVVVQLIALVGWIIVQSFFSLSSPGRAVPFTVTIVIEAVWWIITLVIMFLLFRREYRSFVQAAVELEDANKRLREATNRVLHELKSQSELTRQEPSDRNDQTEHVPPVQSDQAEHIPTNLGDQAEQESPAQSDQTEHVPPIQHDQNGHEPVLQDDQTEHMPPIENDQSERTSPDQSDQTEHDTRSS
jgi:hypothetical protein